MRKLVALIIVLGMAVSASAVTKTAVRRQPAPRHVEVAEPKTHLGWYVAPVVKVGEIRDEMKGMIGIRGGLEINRSFYVGLAGYGLPEDRYNDHPALYHHHDNTDWVLGYGGLETGVIAGRPRSGQVSFGVLIGGGSIDEDNRYFDDYDGFFVMEPQFDFLINVSRNVRLTLGASYRYIDNLQSLHYTEDDLQGPSINIGIALGSF